MEEGYSSKIAFFIYIVFIVKSEFVLEVETLGKNMAITKEQQHWLLLRKAMGRATVGRDLVEVDYDFDIPEDLPEDLLNLINALTETAKAIRLLKEDLK